MNMFCSDEVIDNEQDDEDAGMLELKALVEDKMAEEAKFEEDLFEKTKAEYAECRDLLNNAAAEDRAAILRRLNKLQEDSRKLLKQSIDENVEKSKVEKTKQCDEYMHNLFGEINWEQCLKEWDAIFLKADKPIPNSSSSSAGPSTTERKPIATKANDAKVKSESIYDQFMNKTMPQPKKDESDDFESNIRRLARKYITNEYCAQGVLTDKKIETIVDDITKHHVTINGGCPSITDRRMQSCEDHILIFCFLQFPFRSEPAQDKRKH